MELRDIDVKILVDVYKLTDEELKRTIELYNNECPDTPDYSFVCPGQAAEIIVRDRVRADIALAVKDLERPVYKKHVFKNSYNTGFDTGVE